MHVRLDDLVEIGADCSVGHGALLHGARLKDRVLVGMGAILMDHVQVGEDVIIGAGSVLLEGFQVPDRSVVVGVPAQVIGEVSQEAMNKKRMGVVRYQGLPPLYKAHLREIPPGEVATLRGDEPRPWANESDR